MSNSDAVTWEMPFDIAERYFYFAKAMEQYEITEEEFAESVASLPGYPLKRPLRSGDNLVIRILPKIMNTKRKRIIH